MIDELPFLKNGRKGAMRQSPRQRPVLPPVKSVKLRRAIPLIIIYAIVQHYLWAAMVLWDTSTTQITAIATLNNFAVIYYGAVNLFVVAALATISAFVQERRTAIFLMLPQQFILPLSAFGALAAMWSGHFADGVIRPHAFLIADQAPAVLLAIFHTAAIIRLNGHD